MQTLLDTAHTLNVVFGNYRRHYRKVSCTAVAGSSLVFIPASEPQSLPGAAAKSNNVTATGCRGTRSRRVNRCFHWQRQERLTLHTREYEQSRYGKRISRVRCFETQHLCIFLLLFLFKLFSKHQKTMNVGSVWGCIWALIQSVCTFK